MKKTENPKHIRKELPKFENKEHVEMFEYYYALGKERTHKKVADKFNISRATVHRMAAAFHWTDRLREIGEKAVEKMKAELIENVSEVKKRYRLAIQKSIDTYLDRLERGLISVSDIADLEKLVKLDLLLMGESTEKEDHTYEFVVREIVGRMKDDGQFIEVTPVEPAKEIAPTVIEAKDNKLLIDGEEIEINLDSIPESQPLKIKRPIHTKDIIR